MFGRNELVGSGVVMAKPKFTLGRRHVHAENPCLLG